MKIPQLTKEQLERSRPRRMKHTKIKNKAKCHCGRLMSYIKHKGQWICPTRIKILPMK
jgi:hypothetical protein